VSATLVVERIDTLERLRQVELAWRAVDESDARGTLFTRFEWLALWAAERPGRWLVLAARAGAEYVGFFLMERSQTKTRLPGVSTTTYSMAASSETLFTSLIARPEAEASVVAALGRELSRLPWRELAFRNITDPRVTDLLARLRGPGVRLELREESGYYRMPLPATYEAYLAHVFPGGRGKKLRRYERKAEREGLVLTDATAQTLDAHLSALQDFVAARWGEAAYRSPAARERQRALLAGGFPLGMTHLNALWDGERPVGATVGFVDAARGVYYALLSGYDPDYADTSPGMLLNVAAVRYAIEAGLTMFDWGHGAQSYKQDFCPEAPIFFGRAKAVRLRPYERLTGLLRPATPPLATNAPSA
jgi:CelD/BcsL family acetyltransferase involved in cellulose biosynthesis